MDTDDPSQCKFTILSHAKCNSGKFNRIFKSASNFRRGIFGGFYLFKSYLDLAIFFKWCPVELISNFKPNRSFKKIRFICINASSLFYKITNSNICFIFQLFDKPV